MSDPRRPRGQALVEFAIALPILILLVAGVLELGRGYAVAVSTSDAARDGARYAAAKAAKVSLATWLRAAALAAATVTP